QGGREEAEAPRVPTVAAMGPGVGPSTAAPATDAAPATPAGAPPAANARTDEYRKAYLNDRAALATVTEWIYDGGKGEWPPDALGIATPRSHEAIEAGVERFIAYWSLQAREASQALGQIIDVRDAILERYKDAEARLLALDDEFTPRLARPTAAKAKIIAEAAKEWERRLAKLQEARADAEAKLAFFPHGPLGRVFERQSSGRFQAIETAFASFRESAELTKDDLAEGGGLLDKLKAAAKEGAAKEAEKRGEKPATPAQPDTAKPSTAEGPEEGKEEEGKEEETGAARAMRIRRQVDSRLTEALERIRKIARPEAVASDVAQVDTEFLNPLTVDEHVWRRLLELGLVQPEGTSRDLRLYQYRLLMYQFADAERSKSDEVARRGSFRKAIQGVRQNIDLAANQITQLRDAQPKAYRFEDAAAVSTFTCQRLALPQRIFLMLHNLLSKRPQREAEIAEHVEQRAAAFPALTKPTLPLTSMKGGDFDAQYHPDATMAMLREWAEAGMTLQDQKLEVLQRDKLLALWQRWGVACGAYLTGGYYRYWTQRVPGELESEGEDWKSFRNTWAETQRVETRIFLNLGEVGDAMTKALSPELERYLPTASRANFTRAREAVARSVQQLETNDYKTQCKLVRANWCKLSDDAFEARNVLIGLPRERVYDDYLPFTYKSAAQFADKYWTDLTHEALRLIITWAGRTGLEALDTLAAKYSRFPLDVPRPGEDALTPREVNEARAIVERLVATVRQRGVRSDDDRPTTSRREVERLLDQLVTLKVDPQAWGWLQKLKTVLDGLPSDDNALKCELWLVAKDAPRPAVGDRWAVLRTHLGDKEVGKGPTAPGKDYKVCDVWYPGESLELRFWRHPHDPINNLPPDRVVTVEGPWVPVRLLHPGQVIDRLYKRWQFVHKWRVMAVEARREVADPKVRDILITVEDDQKIRRQLRLRLKLEKGLPKTDAWPTRPKR
ncbi:MAG: hypothetical protein ACODAJ_11635, partial [Planctomycetota bacterium]